MIVVELMPASSNEADIFRNLYELYAYDFSEMHDLDVGADGRFGDEELGGCWSNSRRCPFLMRVNARLAGFSIVDRWSHLTGDAGVCDLAEFFVLRKYRRRGVGTRMAEHLFRMFPGRWEVRQSARNYPAQAFWRRVIGDFTQSRFSEELRDDAIWRGTVQSFTAK